MSIKCSEVVNIMEKLADPKLAMEWDNVGLMLGDLQSEVSNILVALDIDDDVIDEAITKNCQMIITHHPFIYKGIKFINKNDVQGARIIKLIKNDINVYSAHTNLDVADNGTNDTFAKLLKLNNIENLFDSKDNEPTLGRTGYLLKDMKVKLLIDEIKKVIEANNIIICGDLDKVVKKIGICTGGSGDIEYIIQAVAKGCDVYITGDVKYHNAQLARDLGIILIDVTHYKSEEIILPVICEYIEENAKGFNIKCIKSSVNGQTINIV